MKQMSQMPKPATERDEVPVQPRLPSETELEMVSAAGGTAVGVIARQRA